MRTPQATTAEKQGWLEKLPVFKHCRTETRNHIAAFSRYVFLDPGESLFDQGGPAEGFYVLLKGTVKVYRLGMDGREQVLHFLKSGDLVGEVPVFEGKCYPASATSIDRSLLLYLPRSNFLLVARQNPEFLLDLLAVLSRRLREFVNLIDDLSLKEVSSRLARYLLDESNQEGSCCLRVSKTALAARLGTVSATLSRTFRKLEQQGLLQVTGSEITLLDQTALQSLAEGNLCED